MRLPWLHALHRCRSDPTDKNRVKKRLSLDEDALLRWNQWFVKKSTSLNIEKRNGFSGS